MLLRVMHSPKMCQSYTPEGSSDRVLLSPMQRLRIVKVVTKEDKGFDVVFLQAV